MSTSDAGNGVSAPGKVVYLVGSQTLFHEALVACISQSLGVQCRRIHDPAKTGDDVVTSDSLMQLFLIDGSDVDYEAATGQLLSNGGRRGRLVALFNVAANSGIERRAFEKGIRGFFYPTDTLAHLLKGLDALLRGDIWISRSVLAAFALQRRQSKGNDREPKTLLTSRELQILAHLSAGSSNEQIADALRLSPHTVKTHIYNIFKKTGVPNRFQAALWAAKNL